MKKTTRIVGSLPYALKLRRTMKLILALFMVSNLSIYSNTYAATKKLNLVKLKTKVNREEVSNYKIEKITVSGIITDDKGIPIPGVTILEKGTKNSIATDFDGKYVIEVAGKESILVFSYIGFKTQEVPVGEKSKLNISLKEDTSTLDEVIVVGYGVQKKAKTTGAVAEVKGDVLENRPVVNSTQALQGLVAGLNITQSGSQGGSLENRPSINIRGTGTIGDGSNANPLILIDGAEGDLNTINPNDIDNISVLKDASSASIYGSRAAFGVILVTTKKGKSGKTIVNISSSTRISKPILIPDIVDSYRFGTYFNDSFTNAGFTPFFTADRMQRIKDFMDGKITTTIPPKAGNPTIWADGYDQGNDNVDWYKALFKPSVVSTEQNVSLSGGKEGLTYYASAALLDQPGFMNFGGDKFKRHNTTLRINADIFKWLSLTYTNRFVRENYERPSNMTDNTFQNLVRQGWPMIPLYDPNGYLYSSPSAALGLRDGGRDIKVEDTFTQQLNLIFKLTSDWNVKWDFTYKTFNRFQHWDLQYTYNHDVAGNPIIYGNQSQVYESGNKQDYFNSNVYTDYTKSIGKHNFKALLGMQVEETNERSLSASRQGIIVPDIAVIDATSGTDYYGKIVPPSVGGNYKDWATNGYFGRLNYDYDGRYLFEGNLRYDASSRFRSDNRWVLSPSVSVGWNIAKEEFWKPIQNIVGMLKFRASYGSLGNQETKDWYPTYVSMPIGIASGSWLIDGTRPNTSSAPTLKDQALTWETVTSWDAGVDFALFNNKLSGSFDYFNRETKNMIGPAQSMPAILGTAVPKSNNTDLETYGFDMTITWKQKLKNNLSYNITALLSDNRTRITKYPNETGSLSNYNAGQLDGNIWGYETIGIAKTKQEMDAHLASLPNGAQNAFGANWDAGDIMYKDTNGDGAVNNGANTLADHGDLKIIGNNKPRYTFGLDLGANWKGLDFRAFFQGVGKRDYFNDTYSFWGMTSSVWDATALEQHMDYFRNDPNHPMGLNLDSYYPRPIVGGGGDKNHKVQTRYLLNGAYARLKNLQLGYTLSSDVVEKVGIDKIRFYFSAENIWTITSVPKMYDPETLDGGVRGAVYPLSVTYSFGVNITL
ncbi:TonB-linked SusC/RagA family outer membrane protein [Flavobacterium sp. 270]|nr:TonB-linked SusC/RagA family outer membrane protein [Flavobacterium sp. 270]